MGFVLYFLPVEHIRLDRLRESEVNYTQWSQEYPRREGVGWFSFVSESAKPYHIHNLTRSTTMRVYIHHLVSQLERRIPR